ncbi:DUF5696 domain-containing protein [Paenibacillus sp. GCM10012307]|uniref:Uncharacterized protein n=1 Tax=Paenibacillus roseus TaxID=2798579 RepID=A0A934JBE3_9BACL|nr:DUF5696 domain-containing protein [Paenibacillus roseus]MBJ6363952.1 hypothetical protein [Paenibacillus roseus]
MSRHKKWITAAAAVMALILLAVVIYVTRDLKPNTVQPVAQEVEEEVVEDFVLPTQADPDAGQAEALVAENSRYKLYVNEELGNVRIVESSSGKEWFSAPPVGSEMPSNNREFVQAPVHVRFTQGVSPSQTYPKKEKAATKMEKIDQGVRFAFDFDNEALNFGFAVEYRLTDQGFEATIPDSSIYENGRSKITTLELLPFFGAQGKQEQGAVFVPDGSGALIRFKEAHPQYFDGYSEFVYGGDHAFKKRVNQDFNDFYMRKPNVKQDAALPVYGIYRDGSQGFLAIITQGDYDARVNATLPGMRGIDMYRASAEFMYRNDDIIFIGKSGEIPLFQGQRVTGDRTVRYVLLTDDKADYIGMAHAYRDYLIKDRQVQPVKQDQVPLQVRLFGGVRRDEIVGNTYVDMTTFNQAKAIIDAFLEKGVKSLELTIDGWSKDGVYGNQPGHFPIEGKLGGKKELTSLASYAKEHGIDLYLKANYVKPYEDSSKLKTSRDAIRGIDREVRKVPHYYISTRFSDWDHVFYLLKPERVYDKYVSRESGQYAELGIAGVHLQYMGDTLYSDHDPKSLTDRSVTAGVWKKSLGDMRSKVGKTAVDYGYAYTLGLVDRIDNIPVYASDFTFEDGAVPFYQIAIHGLVPYTVSPSNLRDDPQLEFLRALEYGALPSYELTYEPTTKLARSMVERLYSAEYSTWVDQAVNEYETFAKLKAHVKDMKIVNHEQLAEHVFRTTYQDGSYVIVNYGDTSELIGKHTLAARDYAIVLEGEQP